MELLRIENLCKVYGKDENQIDALDHVSLSINKGEFTAIIGFSGSGKSTLLHIIGGVDLPTSGRLMRSCWMTCWNCLGYKTAKRIYPISFRVASNNAFP